MSTVRPLRGKPSFNYGNTRIAVWLPADATFVAIPDGSGHAANAFIQKDGWIRTKVGWWTARGKPRVTGRRTDESERPLRADVAPLSSAGGHSFYPSLLYFPSAGCWKITASAGGSRLVARVKVVKR